MFEDGIVYYYSKHLLTAFYFKRPLKRLTKCFVVADVGRDGLKFNLATKYEVGPHASYRLITKEQYEEAVNNGANIR